MLRQLRHLVSLLMVLTIIALFVAGCGSDDGAYGGDAYSGSPSETGGETPPEDIPVGQLTAGEWRDLDAWDFWLNLFDHQSDEGLLQADSWPYLENYWGQHTTSRLAVAVTADDAPAVNVVVELMD